ncbi:MAG: discoidin domain-containing protein [Pirellulaceae bacterium]
MAAALLSVLCVATGLASEPPGELAWDKDQGVTWKTPGAVLRLDANERLTGPVIRVLPNGDAYPLTDPQVRQMSTMHLELTYRLALPDEQQLAIVRDIEVKPQSQGVGLVEAFALHPAKLWAVDVEIERPFSLLPTDVGAQGQLICPLKSGWARAFPLMDAKLEAEYRLGNPMTGEGTAHLALPVIYINTGRLDVAVLADPTFSALFELRCNQGALCGAVRYRYGGSRVPIEGIETRSFGVWLQRDPPPGKGFEKSLDTFFDLMLPDVPAGPPWLHEIAMIDYDFLSDNGQGWERDVQELAKWLKPEQRQRVAMCLHGWYDALGSYCFDATTKQLKTEWVAFGRTRKVPLTQDELRRRMRLVRSLGFRVLLYFGDGLAADSGVPGYHSDWAYRDAHDQPITGWQGPDTYGPTYLLNPAHPEVSQWYLDYMDALLKTYGDEFDGLVWDETFHASLGQITSKPVPAYCDRAFLALVKKLARRVNAFDPQKVFLASDCIGIPGMENVPGYGMVAHGTWQDSWCYPGAWSYGLFPNWRNVLWSCNWSPIGNFHYTRFGVQAFGVPVAISNGWGDDCGASEWSPDQRDRILALLEERCAQNGRVRYLTTDPAELLAAGPHVAVPGDPLPASDLGLVNWALAARGGIATASSESAPQWPAMGAIDGIRDDSGWGGGHGWASATRSALPQWLQVEFPQLTTINLFAVITYQKEGSAETAGKWGVQDYEIQVWDAPQGQWKTVVQEARGRAVKSRVHHLSESVQTEKIRLVFHRVAPLDGQARLLQFEAWGPANDTVK